VIERRDDASCESGRTPTLDQLDDRVQIRGAFRRDPSSEIRIDAGACQAL
jgi:hypothetical protein